MRFAAVEWKCVEAEKRRGPTLAGGFGSQIKGAGKLLANKKKT